MKALHKINSAILGPDALKVLAQAFEEAWQSIDSNFGSDETSRELARLRLADLMVLIANDDRCDVEVLNAKRLNDGHGISASPQVGRETD
jgi:hypothetical protein